MVPLEGAQETSRGLSPPAPSLSLSPAYSIFFRGEWVHLQCSPPGGVRARGFQFLRRKADGEWDQVTQGTENTLEVSTVHLRSQEAYVCSYLEERSTGNWSSRSKEVAFSVTDRPPPPVFSITPERYFYIRGESIDITCSAPDQRSVSKIFLFKDVKQLPLINTSTFKVTLSLNPRDTGWYSCRYWVMESGQEIPAQETNPIYVSVRDPPPAPLLEVDPPSGEVKEGDPLLITCLANGSNKERRFHFDKDGDEISSSSGGSLRSQGEPRDASPNSSVSIQQAKPSHNGEFTCSYEEEMDGRWISSPWSQKVNITVLVQGSSMQPLVYAWLAIPLLILTVALACYCWREKKKRASKQLQESHPQQNKQKAELDYLRTLATPTATLPPKDSDVTYAHLASCLPKAPTGPATEDGHNLEEEVSYSELLFTRINKASK